MKRREFLKKSTLAVGTIAIPIIVPASALGRNGFTAANDRITMAVIGAGSQGRSNMNGFVKHKDLQIIAVCDVDERRVKQSQNALWRYYENKDCKTYDDFRKLMDKEEFDTASIAVPDHWHMSLYTYFANKKIDIYGEKPLVRKIEAFMIIFLFLITCVFIIFAYDPEPNIFAVGVPPNTFWYLRICY